MQETHLLLREQLGSLAGTLPFGVIGTNQSGVVTLINEQARLLLNLNGTEDVIDQDLNEALETHPDLSATFRVMLDGQRTEYVLERFRVRDNTLRISLRSHQRGYYVFIEDISDTELVREQTLTDSLTMLDNRDSYLALVGDLLNTPSKLNYHLIYFDLDHFKPINELAGRMNGDRVLRHIANLVRKHTRDSDRIMRISGDEFCILTYRDSTQEVQAIAERVKAEIGRAQFNFKNMPFSTTASMCISQLSQVETRDPEVLLNQLDRVCQKTKSFSRNSISNLKSETNTNTAIEEQLKWLPRLDQAIQTDQLELYGQRILSAHAPGVSKVEVLIRLVQDGKVFPPAGLIYAAERYNRIAELDFWVIERVFEGAQSDCNYAINLSAKTLSEPNLIPHIENALNLYQVDPKQITFEITETAVIQDLEQARSVNQRLHDLGFTLALDDFGSGYSSFAYLRELDFDILKIDGVFVRNMDEDPFLEIMVRSITELCHELEMKVVSEYVCCQEVKSKLENCNVDYYQGFEIHKPEPLNQALAAAI